MLKFYETRGRDKRPQLQLHNARQTNKKKEPYHEAPLLVHSHSCCLLRADCLCDLPSHVSARFLFTERHGPFHHTGKCLFLQCHTSLVLISMWIRKSKFAVLPSSGCSKKNDTGFARRWRCNPQFTCLHEPSGENTQNFSTEQVIQDGKSGAETK